MADTEFNDLLDTVQKGSAFDSLRAARQLSALVRSRRDAHSDVAPANIVLDEATLQELVGRLSAQPGGLDRLAEIVEAARSSETQPSRR
jgi:hypothetical protein